jgi:raffinose/stachyose/melibiose transport system permease protein
MPYIIATVVAAHLWIGIYAPFFGLGTVLDGWGLHWANQDWLGQENTALASVAVANMWTFWGFLVVIFLSAMQQVDPSLYEAGRVDGASRPSLLWHVTLPAIRPTLAFMLMMIIVWSFLVFDFVYVMTGGGPGYASQVLALRVYQAAFNEFDAGYASTIALCMSVFCIVIILVYWRLRRWIEADL